MLEHLRRQVGTVEAMASEGYLRALDSIIQLPQALRQEEKRVAMEQELERTAAVESMAQDTVAADGF